MENNNENQKLIKEEWMQGIIEVILEGLETILVEKIRVRGENKEVEKLVKEMKKTEVKVLIEEKWKIRGKLVLKEGKIYMLKNEELRFEVI